MNELVGNSSDVVSAILAAHNSCLEAGNKALLHAKQAGELLTKAKELVKHGEWSLWVQDNLPFSLRTSQLYMKIASGWEQLSNTQSIALLSIADAQKLLAEPKPERATETLFNIGSNECVSVEDGQGWAFIEPCSNGVGFFYVSGVNHLGTAYVARRGVTMEGARQILKEMELPLNKQAWTTLEYSGVPVIHDDLMEAVFPCENRKIGGICRHCDATWQKCADKERRGSWLERGNKKSTDHLPISAAVR